MMSKLKKICVYTLALLYNSIVNKIPSRHIRRLYLIILGAKFGQKTFLFRRVEVLKPYSLEIGDFTSVGWFSLLDARGGLKIGNNVNISSYVKIITGSHDVNDKDFKAKFGTVIIEDNVWIGTGAIILQNVRIGRGAVVAAGAVVTRDVEPLSIVGGVPAKLINVRNSEAVNYTLSPTMILH